MTLTYTKPTKSSYPLTSNQSLYDSYQKSVDPGTICRASAHGKLILIGDHAVCYGAKAVAVPVYGPELSISLSLSKTTSIIINDSDLTMQLSGLLGDALSIMDIPDSLCFQIKAHSSIPLGAGLGSSAALCVALVRSIASYKQVHLEKLEIAKFANKLEERFHGSPSGLDASVVAFDRPIIFSKDKEIKELELAPNSSKHRFYFAIVDSNKRSPTKKMIETASKFFNDPKKGQDLVDKFDAAADELIEGLRNGCNEQVKEPIGKAFSLLKSVGIVTDQLKHMIAKSIELGCLAGKPTGAGGGGCILTLLPNDGPRRLEILESLRVTFGHDNVYGVNL